MSSFNYQKEMIFGNKHLQKLSFDKKKYDFVKIITNIFNKELCKIHTWTDTTYPFFGPDMLGKDSHTEFHDAFYKKIHDGWDEFVDLYEDFIRNVVLPYLGLDEALFQVCPNFRVHLPDNVAVVVEHLTLNVVAFTIVAGGVVFPGNDEATAVQAGALRLVT